MAGLNYGGIEPPALHYLLWTRRETPSTVRIKQTELAAELRITDADMSRAMSTLAREGRITKTSTRGFFRIVNPADWTPDLIGTGQQVSR